MTLSGIISTKTSKIPGKSREVQGSRVKSGGGPRSGNKASLNTFKNTPENHKKKYYNLKRR